MAKHDKIMSISVNNEAITCNTQLKAHEKSVAK